MHVNAHVIDLVLLNLVSLLMPVCILVYVIHVYGWYNHRRRFIRETHKTNYVPVLSFATVLSWTIAYRNKNTLHTL